MSKKRKLQSKGSRKFGESYQTPFESIIEQMVNIGSGMVIAYLTMQLFIAPEFHIGMTPLQNVWTTLILTTISVIRGYLWRRFFNKKLYRGIYAKWLKVKKIRGL